MAIYGIDLGTTYCAAALIEGTHATPRMVPLEGQGFALPSLVLLRAERGTLRATVGQRAREQFRRLVGDLVTAPPDVLLVRGAKSYIGTPGADDEDEHAPPWRVGGHEFNAIDLGAILLRGIEHRVQRASAPKIDRVVVTHPQRFRNIERIATEQAIWLSGLPHLAMLTEPDAAAWAYERYDLNPEKPGRFLVFDFGGGTLDVTLIERAVLKGQVVLRAVDSYGVQCGGLSIDRSVADKLITKFFDSLGAAGRGRTRDDLSAWSRDEFLQIAESLKRALNTEDAWNDPAWRSRAITEEVRATEGPSRPYPPREIELTLGTFCDWITGDVAFALDAVKALLRRANVSASSIDEVRLTGQSSQLVIVRQQLAQLFGRERIRLDTDTASWLHPASIVAAGAAVFGTSKADPRVASAVRAMRGVVPDAISVDTDKGLHAIVPPGSPVPGTFTRTYKLNTGGAGLAEDGTAFTVDIYEGREKTEENCMGTFPIRVPRSLTEGTPVQVTLSVEDSGRFKLGVTVDGFFQEMPMRGVTGIYSESELQRRRDLIRSIVFED